jgi:hypothetical protein
MARWRLGLCAFYGLIALVALIATWSQNLAYFAGQAGPAAFWQFLVDAKANPASRSITADIGFFLLAATAFMAAEARRLGVRWVWAYVLLGFLVAISVTFPLFMIAREVALDRTDPAQRANLAPSDIIGLAATAAVVGGLTIFILI